MEWVVLYFITVLGFSDAMHQQDLVIDDLSQDISDLYEDQLLMETLGYRLAGAHAGSSAKQALINADTAAKIERLMIEIDAGTPPNESTCQPSCAPTTSIRPVARP